MTIMVKSYIDKALRAEHQMKHKQRKSSSISRTHAICLNPTGILTGNVLVRMIVSKELFFELRFSHAWSIK